MEKQAVQITQKKINNPRAKKISEIMTKKGKEENKFLSSSEVKKKQKVKISSCKAMVTFNEAKEIYAKKIALLNYTPKTIKTNLYRVDVFTKWCNSKKIYFLNEVTSEHAQEYILHFKSQGTKAISINKYVTTLRIMYRTLINAGKKLTNVFENIEKMKEDKLEIYAYNPIDVDRFLNYTLEKDNFASRRMYVLFVMALDTGMRVDEMLSLKLESIDFTGLNIFLETTKSRRSRSVPFSEITKNAIEDFIEIKKVFNYPNEYLFVNLDGSPMSYDSVRCYLYRMKIELNFTDGQLNMHRFRHTFCYTFIKNGGDPFALKKIAGHQSLITTLNYVNMGRDIMNEAHQKFSYFVAKKKQ